MIGRALATSPLTGGRNRQAERSRFREGGPAASVVLAAFLTLTPSLSLAADDSACDAVEETFEWTGDLLLAVRDGENASYANLSNYVADAAEYAVDRMQSASWTQQSLDAASRMFVAADAMRASDLAVDAGTAAALLASADIIAPEAAEVCGAEIVPTFVRPGIGDQRACEKVIEALDIIQQALPTVQGESSAPQPTILLVVATNAREAAGRASAAQWSAASVAALNALSDEARALQSDGSRYSDDTSMEFAKLAAPVIDEARAVCIGAEVPSFL